MEDPQDSKYVLKHLSDYINFQISQGYEPDDISAVLAKYGYKKAVIDDLLEKAISESKGQVRPKRAPKEMSKELYAYLHSMLVNFIIKEKEQGYSAQAIRKALLNYGHNPEIVNSAIDTAEGKLPENPSARHAATRHPESLKHKGERHRTHKPKRQIMQNTMPKIIKRRSFGIPAGILFFILVLIIFAFVMFIGIETEDDILLIMLSFFPALLSLTVVYVTILQLRSRRAVNMMAVAGIALTVFIYIAMLQLKSPVQALSDHNLVLVLNILLSFILGSILVIFSKLPKLNKGDEEPIAVNHLKPDSDEKLGMKIEQGSDSLANESKELEKIIGEIKKLPERESPARRISKRKLKIKPID